MLRIGGLSVMVLSLALGSCSSQKVEVRAMPLPESAHQADSESLSRGRMLFARGEFALAADAFRKAVRQDPASADAYNGLAASYDQLGRFDLSRRYYELALAQAPSDGRILRNLARSMATQGDQLAARKLFAEADALGATPVPAAAASEDIGQLASAKPFESGEGSVTVPLDHQPTRVSVDLPPAVPVTPFASMFQRVSTTITTMLPARDDGIDIALDPASTPATSAAPVRAAMPERPVRLHIMNAVGRKHQAARMRSYLVESGWAAASTGDSRRKLYSSRILYSARNEAKARQLAESLPFKPRLQVMRGAPSLFLMLGRDSVPFDNRLRSVKQG
jgi:Tfp pilus assembly protein PilF